VNANLLKSDWAALESDDLRVLLENRVGGPGQTHGNDRRLFLPLAGSQCRLILSFDDNRISHVIKGPAFDAAQWSEISATLDALLTTPPDKFGKDIAFSAYRVTGWWRGEKSGVQILPPPYGAPLVPTEMGEHPFVLEFPLHSDSAWAVTNARRLREHRRLALLLNLLLRGRIKCQSRQAEHVWALVDLKANPCVSKWAQRSYFGADLSSIVTDSASSPSTDTVQVLPSQQYYDRVGGLDGLPLRVPDDLDESLCLYKILIPAHREKFNRALFWLDVASAQWTISMSSSFASLVSAIEALTDRGVVHRIFCRKCRAYRDHDVPGPTALFRKFFERYAPGHSLKKRREEMYSLRSGISHGGRLIAFDEGRAVGWDPPWSNQRELHSELWSITRIAMRNYLRNPSGAVGSSGISPWRAWHHAVARLLGGKFSN
jgi:hypothetical protein